MKNRKHQNTFEDTMEAIEGIIETIDTDKPIRLSDIEKKANVTMTSAIKSATVMLLMKYGVRYIK